MYQVERDNGIGWRREGAYASRSAALEAIERLRAHYGRKTRFRIKAS